MWKIEWEKKKNEKKLLIKRLRNKFHGNGKKSCKRNPYDIQ